MLVGHFKDKSIQLVFALSVLVGGLPAYGLERSVVFFEDNFEKGGLIQNAAPVWSWKPPFDPANPAGAHIMYGPGDFYVVSSAKARAGKYSLKLDFNGRNGFCNTCGTEKYIVDINSGSGGSLIADNGSVIHAHSAVINDGHWFYNRSDAFSKWKWVSVKEALLGQGGKPARNDMNGRGLISNKDELLMIRQCGIDGTVGGNISRRSDCDNAINYLQGIKTSHFPYGGTISRRFYFYIPEETTMPNITFKLGYVFFNRPNEKGGKSRVGFETMISVQRGSQPEINARTTFDKYVFVPMNIGRNRWYYLEEVWQRESHQFANNAEYRLYLGSDSEDLSNPVVHLEGGRLGELLSMSIVGNWQHLNDAKGVVYIDEVRVANKVSGPVREAPPGSPNMVEGKVVR